MEEFGECIKNCEMEDLSQTGLFFSWSNKRAGQGAIAKKIDRVLGNWGWFNECGNLQVHFPPPGISDHSPSILQLKRLSFSRARPFKYLNVWASHPSFLALVNEVWSQPVGGSPLEAVGRKLRMLKSVLKELHRKYFKDLSTTCTLLKQEIEIH
ncbi:hypothetical protein CFOL_v3_29540 [Cephalotus follicularis]|uniref:Exo_endo_phos domain-containing protein n=1 Tax=Cephalotus follicularis TaxID=3775 RepID=A0A1Q3D0T6_CEPFO|nr:hypothetical protein CFOL_v3_29540 [Cephalotus follicularis]